MCYYIAVRSDSVCIALDNVWATANAIETRCISNLSIASMRLAKGVVTLRLWRIIVAVM
jgi:hypothetical protein